jgi:hypothetical protein
MSTNPERYLPNSYYNPLRDAKDSPLGEFKDFTTCETWQAFALARLASLAPSTAASASSSRCAAVRPVCLSEQLARSRKWHLRLLRKSHQLAFCAVWHQDWLRLPYLRDHGQAMSDLRPHPQRRFLNPRTGALNVTPRGGHRLWPAKLPVRIFWVSSRSLAVNEVQSLGPVCRNINDGTAYFGWAFRASYSPTLAPLT